MSSFGNGDIKNIFEEDINFAIQDKYGVTFYELSEGDKLRVIHALLEVINYLTYEYGD